MKTREEVEKEIEVLGWWYQHFEFPNGARTGLGKEPGYDAEKRWNFIEPYIPKDLRGKTVLDLGGNAGYFSIQMKLRGAEKCVLVDPFVQFIKQARFAAEQFNVELELVNDDAHTFCLTTEDRFDFVIFLGLLYHLKYPGLVLDRLAEMTKERIFIQSNIIGTGKKTYAKKANYHRSQDESLLEDPSFPKFVFIQNSYNNDDTNWWIPNYTALGEMVTSAGLEIIDRPHSQIIIAKPGTYLGKVVLPKLVFPRYAKKGGPILPGTIDPGPAVKAELTNLPEPRNRMNPGQNARRILFDPLRTILKKYYRILRAKYYLFLSKKSRSSRSSFI